MKTKQINGIKIKVFEENELKEKLGMNQKEIELISKYQDKFPELLQDDIEGFVINARTLWQKLEEGAEYSTWFKRRSSKLKLIENIDYSSIDTTVKRENGGNVLKEKYVTLDVAKDISMLSGTEIGNEVRSYFKLMEKTLRNYEKWQETREPEKQEYNIMVDELSKWCERNNYDIDDKIFKSFRARECNMINLNLTGKIASELKSYIGYKDNITRDHLNEKLNSAILDLEKLNTNLLIANMDFETRSNLIKSVCMTKYNDLHIK
jgi:phage anti-repressor protein